MLRPLLLDRARWPMYPVEHSFRSRARPFEDLAVPGLPQQENPTGWNPWTGRVDTEPPTLEPAYGTFYDSSPNVGLGGGPGAGAGVMSNWGGITPLMRLDPSRHAEATPGVAPKLASQPNPSMDFRPPPTLGDISYKIPAGP